MNAPARARGAAVSVILVAAALAVAFPLYWIAVTAFKPSPETFQFPPSLWPHRWDLNPLGTVWQTAPMLLYYRNSILVVAGILSLQLATVILAAYAFAVLEFPGRDLLFYACLVPIMMPEQVLFIPDFIILRSLHLLDTLAGLVLPFATSAFGIFLVRQAFRGIPGEFIDAARAEGAGDLAVIRHVMIPLGRPMIVTFGVFSFVFHWNDYFWPLIMTNAVPVRTLPLGVATFYTQESGVVWNQVMAANLLLVLPILVVFALVQPYIVRGFQLTLQ
jgi:sn-glycerol 3-phosphate transport system permease protein